MKTPVQSTSTKSSLVSAFRSYLLSLGLSSISCKLYTADVARLLSSSNLASLTLSTLGDPKFYTDYLTKPEFGSSATLLRRTLASLRRFGSFLTLHYGIQNPTSNLSLTVNTPDLTLSPISAKYIKAYIEYLKNNHLSDASLRSYKSDITQYLTYLESHHPSTHIVSLLNEKNIKIYTDLLTHLQTQSPATIERKTKTIRQFTNWHDRFKLKVVVSDNNNIAASTPKTNPLSSAVSPRSSYPADTNLTTQSLNEPSPDVTGHFVKNNNYRKLKLPSVRSLLSFAVLLLFVSTLSIFTYRQFGSSANLTAAFPSTPITPNRQLSFQGRLENASGTPITSATNFVFKLFDASSGGTELYSSGTCSITPDTDGVFSTQIGGTCGSGIASNVFTENQDVWLEVTVAAETLTPRQQIATVAYALNSETIQGFPISATVSAIRNTVVPMNQWGEIIVGEQSPRLTGVAGTFQISAPSLSLVTATGTNGNITLAPDGTGQVNIQGNTTTTNFFNVSNAQLTTGSLLTGTVANNNAGFRLLDLLSGSSPTSKFSVDASGNTTLAGTLTLPNSNTLTGVTNYTQFSNGVSVGGGTTYYINSSGTGNLNGLTLAGTLDANGQVDLGDGGDAITLNGSSLTLTGFDCSSYSNGGTLTTNGSGVLQCSNDDGGGGSGGLWADNTLGAISPLNSTWDVLVGGTATSSAKAGFININSGTPTATVSAGTSGGAFLTASGNLATTANQSLTLGNNTTGNIILAPGGATALTASGANLVAGGNLTVATANNFFVGTTALGSTTAGNDSGAYLIGVFDEFTHSNSGNVQDVLDDLDSQINALTVGSAGPWTDAGSYLHPTNSEYLGNNTSGGGDKLGGLYLADNAPLVLGTDNDNTIQFNGTLTTISGNTQFNSNAYFGGGTSYYIDGTGNARFLDLIVADTANPGLTIGNGSIGFMQLGGTTIADNNGKLGLEILSPNHLLTVGDYNAGTTSNLKQGLLSVDNSLLAQLEGGSYFGGVGLTENHFNLENIGNVWTAKDSNRNWAGVSMSSNGAYQTATAYGGQIYVSTDYGNTWSAKDSSRNWRTVDMSSDGKIQTAIGYNTNIYVSTDYGNTWSAKDSSRNWYGVSVSGDGRIQTATEGWGGQIYVSTDYGNTWSAKDSSRDWQRNEMSNDGKVQAAVVYGGQIYVSTDYGNTWSAKDSSRDWVDVSVSSDGKLMTAVVYGGQIYVSTDYGNTWSAKDSSRDWQRIALTSSGQIQLATDYGGQIYVSTDYGNTWSAKDSSRNWNDITISSDGRVATSVVGGTGQIYVSYADTALAGSNLALNGQLQLGSFSTNPTAIGAGTMVYNSTSNTFQCYNGTDWYNCGGTLFSNTNASVADGSYITVAHNLATNDLLSTAWINSQGVWKNLDATYKPAIAWEGKDTQKGVYHNNINSYSPSSETGTSTSTLHDGLLFDTFEDTTKTDSGTTTASQNSQLGDDGSANFTTLDQRLQGGRVGLMGGQTLSTGETDNDGQAYLGSNVVNDMYYYDRAKDSTPEVLAELGIDPNWYNGVTLAVATTSAQYSQSGTLAEKNPNLTKTYNGSLVKATGTDTDPRTIYITIKSPTTFDWTNYHGDSATGVTITPGTAQTLGDTNVSVTFTGGVNYNVGDVFRIASWYIEGESSTRGAKQAFPERSYIVANNSGIDVIDADTQKLWMRFSSGSGYYVRSGANRVPRTVEMLNGKLYFGQKDDASANSGILERISFDTDGLTIWTTGGKQMHDLTISGRNSSSNLILLNTTELLVHNDVNDLAASVIPNAPTQEITVSGWGYIQHNNTASTSETVVLPYKFNSNPNIIANHAGLSTSGVVPTSLSNCNANPGLNATIGAITNQAFTMIVRHNDNVTTIADTYYSCYTWTATGTVSPKQFVAAATGATSADGATTVINETDGARVNILLGSQYADPVWQSKVAFAGNSIYSAFGVDATTDATYLGIYDNVHGLQSETSWAQYANGSYAAGTMGGSYGTILGTATGYNQITSLTATKNTSSNEASSNTIYVGTTSGTSVINEYIDYSNIQDGNSLTRPSSVKYYTKDYISEEMIGDIRGMWPLNNSNSSSDFEDISIKAMNLTGNNITAAGDSVSGVRGTATDFDGSTEYLYCNNTNCGAITQLDANGSSTTTWSVGAWIYPTSTNATQMIISKWNAGGYYLRLESDQTITFSAATSLISSGKVKLNQWNHIVGTLNGTTLSIYINGQLAGTGTNSTSPIDNAAHFSIGAWHNGTTASQYFTGYIDEPFVTGTAISETQARNMYQVGYRALQSHGTGLSSGTADGNQALAGASNNIGVVMPDYNNQYLYVGTNHTTDGALTKIQLNSDTAIKNYDAGDNDPDGGAQIVDDDITSLAVGETLYAVGSAASGVKTMGLDNNATATSGNFVSKTYTLPKNIGSAVIWASPVTDGSDGSNTITVQASNDGGSNYVTCTLVGTDNNYTVAEKEYACTFATADNDLKVRFQFARGNTKTNTYLVQYGISWLGETGFRLEQVDNNNTRLYNFSGETQNLKLNVSGAGTATLANPWTDAGSYLYPTGYETIRIYDGAGTNYLSLSHDGTLANFGINGTTLLSLNTTGDLLPNTDDAQNLGSDTKRWKDLYLGGETLHIGSSSTDEGTVSYDTTTNILNFGTDSTTNGDIAFFTDDLYLDKSTGRVGFGTTSPLGKFDIKADTDEHLLVRGNVALSTGSSLYSVNDTNSAVLGMEFGASSFYFAGGNVGIGSTTPSTYLHVAGAANNQQLRISDTGISGSTQGRLEIGYDTTNNYGRLQAWDDAIGTGNILLNPVGGNVGIGSTSPGESLEIRTTGTFPMRLYNNSVDSTEYWSVGPTGSDNFAIFNNSSTGMYIAYGATSWTANSDERLKTNINPIASDEGLSALLQLTPVDYNWKDVEANQNRQTGFIAQEVQRLFPDLVSLGETTTITLADGTTETVETPLGVNYTGFIPYIIKGIQQQQAQINNLIQSGLTNLSNLITPSLQTNVISPLAEGSTLEITAPVTITPTTSNPDLPTLIVEGEIDATTISARLAQLEEVRAEVITAKTIVADTITANTIAGLDAKLASLSAGLSDSEVGSLTERIRARLSELNNPASANDVPLPAEYPTEPSPSSLLATPLATVSATLASADIDFATINNYLAVIGSATITDLSITNHLYTNHLSSQTGTLALQPQGGLINLANNTLLVDSTGSVTINGDLTINGRLVANAASINSLELGAPPTATSSSALGNLLSVYNEQGVAVATIDASGSANVADLRTQLITIASAPTATTSASLLSDTTTSNATAGESQLISPNTELTIESPHVTPHSLVYLTPTTNTDNKVLFVKAKNTCDSSSLAQPCTPSFTVGIDAPASSDISFNWWIIALEP